MSKIKVSVLVPVYNVESYLSECLDSLIGQTLRQIEIICINDGSTDGSLAVLKKYADGDERIIVIDKKNTGYGDSMNVGLEKAKGEYVGIVEPDDFIDLDTFERLYKVAIDSEADVVKANFYNYVAGKDVGKSEMFLKDEIGRVIDTKKNQHIFYQQPSIWSAIYQMKFLRKNGIRFLPTEGASYQDAGFNFKVWAMARRVCFMDEAFLHYRQDNPSSSVKSSGKLYAVKKEYDEAENYLKERELLGVLGPTLAVARLGGYMWNLKRLPRKAAMEFVPVMEEDYRRYREAGYLDLDKIEDKNGLYIAKNLAVRHPVLYLNIRPLYEFRNLAKTWGLKTYRK